jgi:methionyl-tRNA formyltransferase
MRTVLLGTSEFAAALLRRLAAGQHRPALVVTRPDRPAGRGRRMQAPPVALLGGELGIEVLQPEHVNDEASRAAIAAVKPDAVLVCAFGALITEPLLSEHELLNVHPSLLPRWRGAAPIERAIMAGDRETGVSIMRLTAGLDSGPVCLVGREPIGPDDTYGSLAPRLEDLGAGLLARALDALADGAPLDFSDQNDSEATYAEKISAGDRLLDPARPAVELERVVRALHPHVGARLRPSEGALGVLSARVADVAGEDGMAPEAPAEGWPQPGRVVGRHGRLLYGTAEGALELLEVQPPGKRPMDAASYLRGHAR